LNVPDNCIMYIDDIVIPVSCSSIDDRNTQLYLYIEFLLSADYKVITIPKIITLDLHSQKHQALPSMKRWSFVIRASMFSTI
jgi:hypothetical protein